MFIDVPEFIAIHFDTIGAKSTASTHIFLLCQDVAKLPSPSCQVCWQYVLGLSTSFRDNYWTNLGEIHEEGAVSLDVETGVAIVVAMVAVSNLFVT